MKIYTSREITISQALSNEIKSYGHEEGVNVYVLAWRIRARPIDKEVAIELDRLMGEYGQDLMFTFVK